LSAPRTRGGNAPPGGGAGGDGGTGDGGVWTCGALMDGGAYPVAGVEVGTGWLSRPASIPMTIPMPPSNNAPTTPMTAGTIQRPRGALDCGATISVGPVMNAGCWPLWGPRLVGATLAA